ncbi:MAG: 2-oxoacid:acceptor oxidoreductase subunit alpha [Flavobacteriales bacterium]|nr:2-oxoacid:acceptor oxidoreductase subunit alpha [Flavobacteriales bacterium]
MTKVEKPKEEIDKVVIRFAGDSGDGMQLTGSQFTFTSALLGNDVATFPDFPAEIRAPIGTVAGVSGFQVQIGKVHIHTPGDESDVFVAMNPAGLRSNLKWVRQGGTVVIDTDSFTAKDIEKAGYEANPLEDDSLSEYNLVSAPITTLVKTALEGVDLDMKSVLRCRNMFALGMMYWLFDRDVNQTVNFLETKFKNKPAIVEGNVKALHAGYFYAETVEALPSRYTVPPAVIEKGNYRHISGNQATAWGFLAASQKLGRNLFYGSYPITPASDVLHELSKHKQLGVVTMQAEDEIAAVCSAIGASYAGNLGVTASSGPGIALKGEAIGLAVMTELPLVVINVQRAGPSTGMPTKTEQADLMLSLHGRNSESPCIVVAGSTPSNCFTYAFEAARLAVEHMTPVIFLSDGYLGNGSEPWKYPTMADLPDIVAPEAKGNGEGFLPYVRDEEKMNRPWVIPGTKGFEHRMGGIEKEDLTGAISYDPENHENMVGIRAEKVARVANYIPEQEVVGEDKGEVLVVGWGSTRGSLFAACKNLQEEGKSVSMAHFNYLSPLPKNTGEIFGNFKKIIVFELNLGQLAGHLRSLYPEFKFDKYNKVQGLPLTVSEIKEEIEKHC